MFMNHCYSMHVGANLVRLLAMNQNSSDLERLSRIYQSLVINVQPFIRKGAYLPDFEAVLHLTKDFQLAFEL